MYSVLCWPSCSYWDVASLGCEMRVAREPRGCKCSCRHQTSPLVRQQIHIRNSSSVHLNSFHRSRSQVCFDGQEIDVNSWCSSRRRWSPKILRIGQALSQPPHSALTHLQRRTSPGALLSLPSLHFPPLRPQPHVDSLLRPSHLASIYYPSDRTSYQHSSCGSHGIHLDASALILHRRNRLRPNLHPPKTTTPFHPHQR
jgi:hypothetical protein